MRTALIVSGGGYQGLALVKALRAAGDARVLVADCHAENVARYFADAFFQAPMLEPSAPFLAFALDLCQRESITDVFAASSYELDLLDTHRQDFSRLGARVWVSRRAVLDLAGDKLAFYAWLAAQGVPCLPSFSTPGAPGATFPMIGKPRAGCGGRGVRTLASLAEASQEDLSDAGSYVWQPRLQGFDEYSVDFAVDEAGAASRLSLRRRIRVLGGFAILTTPEAPPNVMALAERLVDKVARLGALGPMNAQILHTAQGCWVSDLNPRVGTSMPLSLAAGHNPVAFLFGHASADAPASGAPAGGRSFRYLQETHVQDLCLEGVGGVVFDLDDTLLDQKRWILDKLEITWACARASLPSRTDFLWTALRILEEGNRAHLFDGICAELALDDATRYSLIDIYRSAEPARGALYEDAQVCLERLRRLGYRLGILTDNPADSQRLKVATCGLTNHVDACVYTGDLKTQKPDPRAFDAAARTLELHPEQVVMVGDNLFRDVLGAAGAGFRHAFHIQRPGGFFNFNPALAQEVDRTSLSTMTTVSNLRELLWYLKGAHA